MFFLPERKGSTRDVIISLPSSTQAQLGVERVNPLLYKCCALVKKKLWSDSNENPRIFAFSSKLPLPYPSPSLSALLFLIPPSFFFFKNIFSNEILLMDIF